MKVTHNQATRLIEKYLDAKIVPLLKGSPGIGKSDIMRAIAEKRNLKLVDVRLSQCDPTDLNGFPRITEHSATYVPFDTFPTKHTELPIKDDGTPYDGWLIFLDELTSAVPAVQAPAYKLILDRMVGNHDLHDKVWMVAAGNLETDNAIVEEMSTALKSRMAHLELEIKNQDWLDWASDSGLDYRITSFISFAPHLLYNFDPDSSEDTYACPRTWSFVDRLIRDNKGRLTPDDRLAISGVISEPVSSEFYVFCQIFERIPKLEDILSNPTTTDVPDEPAVLFAITGSLSHNFTMENAATIMEYIKRFPMEFQVVALRDIVRRHRKEGVVNSPAIRDWITSNSADLFATY